MGLTCLARIFTWITKVFILRLRAMGNILVIYFDDILILSTSLEEERRSV